MWVLLFTYFCSHREMKETIDCNLEQAPIIVRFNIEKRIVISSKHSISFARKLMFYVNPDSRFDIRLHPVYSIGMMNILVCSQYRMRTSPNSFTGVEILFLSNLYATLTIRRLREMLRYWFCHNFADGDDSEMQNIGEYEMF